jgi:SAM-dependent methyltransferase
MRSPYSDYASIYDRVGQSRFGTELAKLTLAWLSEHGIRPTSALDLATGTGAAALEFARAGLTVTGLDRSAQMLNEARAKAHAADLTIEFLEQDIRSFSLNEPVDLVSCFFDSLNYLITDQDLLNTFRSVSTALNPAGWFVFDLNTIHRYNTAWNNSTELAFQDANTFVIYRSSFDPLTGISPLVLTAFERIAPNEDVWRRWDEQHDERGFPLALVQSMLQDAGMRVIAVEQLSERTMTLDGPATERSPRAVFFVQKSNAEPENVS